MSEPRPTAPEDWSHEPPAWLYIVAALAAGIAAYIIVSQRISGGFALFSALIAAFFAAFGVFANEPVIEAIVITAICAALLAVLPKNFWSDFLVFPFAIGTSIGRLLAGFRHRS